MIKRFLPLAIIVSIFVASAVAKRLLHHAESEKLSRPSRCRRIVSMAPSITETLYALELGDRVAGVTRYCAYPPAAIDKPKVGGYHDPNFEAVFALRPDLVVLHTGDPQSASAFEKLGLRTLEVCHNNVDGILASLTRIGGVCGREDKARQIVADIQSRLRRVRRKTAGLKRPRVLIVIQRTEESNRLEHVCVAGADGFFDKMIALTGGENAFPPSRARFPRVSAEGILWVNPQVILDMTAGLAPGPQDAEPPLAVWQQIAEVEAVETGRVHALNADYAFVPGPRFILLVEELARLIHPEIDWEGDD